MAASSRVLVSPVLLMYVSVLLPLYDNTDAFRLNRTSLATELDPALQLRAALTRVMTMIAVVPRADTVLDVTATVTEVLLAVATMMMIAVATALPRELVARLMITLLPVAASRILTAATTLLTHTPMADLPMIDPLHGTTPQETLPTITNAHLVVTSKLTKSQYLPSPLTQCRLQTQCGHELRFSRKTPAKLQNLQTGTLPRMIVMCRHEFFLSNVCFFCRKIVKSFRWFLRSMEVVQQW